jgi:hypothetical protein
MWNDALPGRGGISGVRPDEPRKGGWLLDHAIRLCPPSSQLPTSDICEDGQMEKSPRLGCTALSLGFRQLCLRRAVCQHTGKPDDLGGPAPIRLKLCFHLIRHVRHDSVLAPSHSPRRPTLPRPPQQLPPGFDDHACRVASDCACRIAVRCAPSAQSVQIAQLI